VDHIYDAKWSNEKVKQEIKKVQKALLITRMPSNSEIKFVTKGSALSSKISRSGGFRYWADVMGLETKKSDTSLGFEYEVYIKNILEGKGYQITKMTTKHPYDLLINNDIKVDVKVAKPYTNPVVGTFHTFNLEKKYSTCDIYIAVALKNDGEIERIFVIPSKFLKIRQLSVGKESIYNKYVDKWEYVSQYDKLYKDIV